MENKQLTLTRRSHKGLAVVLVLAAAVVALRLCLSGLVKTYVNRPLNDMPGYAGRVGAIDIALLRGAYRIRGISLEKVGDRGAPPLFSARSMDLAVQWKELFHGALVGEIAMDGPQVNFTAGHDDPKSHEKTDERLVDRIKRLFPLRINRLAVDGGQLHFRDPSADPPVDLYLRDVKLVALNLTNSAK